MGIKNICVKDLQKKLSEDQDVLLIDCREQEEWDTEHVSEAKFLPLSQMEQKFEEITESHDKEIYFICRSGARSYRMATYFASKGFKNVSNVEGGIISWTSEGFPTIKK